MSDLVFEVIDAVVDPYVLSPAITLRVRLRESTGVKLAIALRAQVRLDVQRRGYRPEENELLGELFGTPSRYGETLKPLVWTHVSQTIGAFERETLFDLALPCSYDLEVAANKYFASLRSGTVPLTLLFNGQIFVDGPNGVVPEFVPWDREARFDLPVATWQQAVNAFFPNSAWIRVDRAVFDDLRRCKEAMGMRSWDAMFARLTELAKAGRG